MSDSGDARDEGGTASGRNCGAKRRFDMKKWWEDRGLGEKIGIGIVFAILGLGLLALFGGAIMLLWNALMPEIFGLKRIGYWQAWGLLALSSIFFKGAGGNGHSGRSDRKRKQELRRRLQDEGCGES